MIVAVVVPFAAFVVAITEWEWVRVEGTEDDFGVGPARLKMRKIYVIKKTGFDRSSEQFGQDPTDPAGGPLPIQLHPSFVIVRKRDAGPSVQNRFPHCGDRAGVINVSAEIATVINPAEHESGIRHQPQQSGARAIGRGAVNRPSRFSAR